eukprot:2601412-Rhodomonas_salina.1
MSQIEFDHYCDDPRWHPPVLERTFAGFPGIDTGYVVASLFGWVLPSFSASPVSFSCVRQDSMDGSPDENGARGGEAMGREIAAEKEKTKVEAVGVRNVREQTWRERNRPVSSTRRSSKVSSSFANASAAESLELTQHTYSHNQHRFVTLTKLIALFGTAGSAGEAVDYFLYKQYDKREPSVSP